MIVQSTDNRGSSGLMPWFTGLTLAAASLGFTGCKGEKSQEPAAGVVSKTEAYTDLGEGIFLIQGYRRADENSVTFAINFAAWKKSHPNLEIVRFVPNDDRHAHQGSVMIETRPKKVSDK